GGGPRLRLLFPPAPCPPRPAAPRPRPRRSCSRGDPAAGGSGSWTLPEPLLPRGEQVERLQRREAPHVELRQLLHDGIERCREQAELSGLPARPGGGEGGGELGLLTLEV